MKSSLYFTSGESIHPRFIPLHKDHFPLLYQWLNFPAQLKGYGNGYHISLKDIEEKYTSYCCQFKEEDGQKKPLYAFVIAWDKAPIGFIQFYNADDFKRENKPIPLVIKHPWKKLQLLIFSLDLLNI